MEKLKKFNQNVDWDKWTVVENRGFIFTFKTDNKRKAIFNFSMKSILVYQLIYDKTYMCAVMSYDNMSLSNILSDWENNEIYWKLRV